MDEEFLRIRKTKEQDKMDEKKYQRLFKAEGGISAYPTTVSNNMLLLGFVHFSTQDGSR